MAIMQGTTPIHTFKLPFDTSIIKTVRIIYSQCGKKLFSREGDQVRRSENIIETTLTQEETFKIDPENIVEIQIRIIDNANNAANTRIMRVSAEKCLETEVLE